MSPEDSISETEISSDLAANLVAINLDDIIEYKEYKNPIRIIRRELTFEETFRSRDTKDIFAEIINEVNSINISKSGKISWINENHIFQLKFKL